MSATDKLVTDHPSHLELSNFPSTREKLGNVTSNVSQDDSRPQSGPRLPASPRFDGAVYDPALDQARLTKQLGRVYGVMASGRWLTLQDIADATGDPHASNSAQLRHLRKKRFGSHVVEKRRRTATSGTYEYRLVADREHAVVEIQ